MSHYSMDYSIQVSRLLSNLIQNIFSDDRTILISKGINIIRHTNLATWFVIWGIIRFGVHY